MTKQSILGQFESNNSYALIWVGERKSAKSESSFWILMLDVPKFSRAIEGFEWHL